MNYNEHIVFLTRETGWTLDYIRSLPLLEFNALIEELQYQKSLDDYKLTHNAALIVSALVSTRQRRITPRDIIGEPPQRKDLKKEEIWQIAERQGIRIPKT